eukprot:2029459-Karenia_brevis.AAC.1
MKCAGEYFVDINQQIMASAKSDYEVALQIDPAQPAQYVDLKNGCSAHMADFWVYVQRLLPNQYAELGKAWSDLFVT